ncbi:uncharacterized protein LOC129589817 [Paramacrobiotus metropolitanus]|uniref:uncharacterized protein LOC129589817 n=1 Tax=Paramacrobiotus metropolitanus TaxID=2943436 RepID=UPI0024461A46|nr:uncharacterized protein LOC129589817 [Paramacrobiotus metropolitanus]
MMPSAARIPLRLLILPVLLSPCGCVIQIYEIENDTVAQEPVYTVSNNYQTVVGQRNADIPIYLKVADPLNACDAEKLPPAPSLSEGSQMSVVFLLADDEACARRKEKPSTMRKWQFAQDSVDGDEFAKKILNAQAKGYSGVIVQASLFEDRTKPGAHGSVNLTAWPTRSRTEPFPVAIPQALTSRLTVDVHFVSYEEGKRLTKFAYYPSSEIRYRLNFTLPTESARASSHEDDGILPGFSNWTISQLQRFPELKSTDASDSETTTEFDPIAFIAELRSDQSQRYGGPIDTLDYSTTTETFSSSSDSRDLSTRLCLSRYSFRWFVPLRFTAVVVGWYADTECAQLRSEPEFVKL